jgi:uncharacterized protein YdhG (YjbR/CyaY superfamily)
MKKTKPGAVPKTVDEYLAALPDDARTTLEKVRKTIRAAAPIATEVISYQMPMYKHHGMVVGFAAFKDHCSLFPGSTAVETFKNELKGYQTSKGTIRFPTNKPMPAALLKKIVKSCVVENEERAKKKAKR